METYILLACLILTGLLLLLSIFFIITLSDLECDYLNPLECCEKLNMLVLPRIIIQILIDILCCLAEHYYLAFANLVFSIWLLFQKFNVRNDSLGVYDPVEIHNRGQVKNYIMCSLIVSGWYLAAFFWTMYMMVLSVFRGGEPMFENGIPVEH